MWSRNQLTASVAGIVLVAGAPTGLARGAANQSESEVFARLQPGDDVPSLVKRLQDLLTPASKPADAASEARRREDVIRTRAALIEAAPLDERAPTWLLDQAESMLSRAAADGSEASVLFGMPTAAQAKRSLDAAEEAARLVTRADGLIDGIVARLEERVFASKGAPDATNAAEAAARDADAQIGRLIDTERGVRVILLRGRADVLRLLARDAAGRRGDASRTASLHGSVQSLSALQIVQSANAAGSDAARYYEASRRLSLSAALLARRDAASAPVVRRLVQDLAAPITSAAARDDQATDGSRYGAAATDWITWQAMCASALAFETSQEAEQAAEMLAARLGEVLGGAAKHAHADEGADGHRESRALLLAECVARVRLDSARPAGERTMEPAARAARVNAAAKGLVRLLDVRADDAWRSMVYEKIAAVAATGGDDQHAGLLDPHVAFAAALRQLDQASEAETPAAGSARRASAAAALRAIAEREDAGAVRADALWELVVVLTRRGESGGDISAADRDEAIDRIATLVSDHAGFRRVREAAVAGAALCLTDPAASLAVSGRVAREAMDDAAVRRTDRRISVLRFACDIEPAPEATPAWALELARLHARRWIGSTAASAACGASSTNDVAHALDAFRRAAESGAAATRTEPIARAADLDARALMSRVFAPVVFRRLTPEAKRALAAAAEAWATARAPAWRPLARFLRLEEAAPTGSSKERVEELAALARWVGAGPMEDKPEAPPDVLRSAATAILPRVRLALGRAQRDSGEAGAAFETLRQLAEELDRAPTAEEVELGKSPAPARPEEFWCAWAELVEMLSAENALGDRSASIRLQMNRLQLIDARFGDGPCGERIRTVGEKLPP